MAVEGGPNITEDGLIMYFDAANPKSYNSGDTTWVDLSKNGNHAAMTGVDATNFNNGILTLNDGVSGEYGTVPHSTTMNIQSSMTVCLFTKATSSTFNIYWNGVSKYSQFILGPNSLNDMAFLIWNGSAWYPTNYNSAVWGQNGLDYTKFHYYVGVYDQENNKSQLYVDGVAEGSEHTTVGSIASDAGPCYIAKRDGSAHYLNSNIGIVQLYNKALSVEEIKQNYEVLKGRFA